MSDLIAKLALRLYNSSQYGFYASPQIVMNFERVLREAGLGDLLRIGDEQFSLHSDYCYVGDPDQVNYPDTCVCNKPAWDAAKAKLEAAVSK